MMYSKNQDTLCSRFKSLKNMTNATLNCGPIHSDLTRDSFLNIILVVYYIYVGTITKN